MQEGQITPFSHINYFHFSFIFFFFRTELCEACTQPGGVGESDDDVIQATVRNWGGGAARGITTGPSDK